MRRGHSTRQVGSNYRPRCEDAGGNESDAGAPRVGWALPAGSGVRVRWRRSQVWARFRRASGGIVRGAALALAAMLPTVCAPAWGGTIDTVAGPSAPAGGSSDVGRSSSILFTAPASVTAPAATAEGKTGLAAGVSAGERGTLEPEGVSNGTVRMLLSPPPRGSGFDD